MRKTLFVFGIVSLLAAVVAAGCTSNTQQSTNSTGNQLEGNVTVTPTTNETNTTGETNMTPSDNSTVSGNSTAMPGNSTYGG